MNESRKEIMQNVFLTYLPADKFKTSALSAHLVTPLKKETASANALLPAVLRRGTMRCPDMESLSAALDTLYGAQIDYTVRKKGSASAWVLWPLSLTMLLRRRGRSCWSLWRIF